MGYFFLTVALLLSVVSCQAIDIIDDILGQAPHCQIKSCCTVTQAFFECPQPLLGEGVGQGDYLETYGIKCPCCDVGTDLHSRDRLIRCTHTRPACFASVIL